VTTITALVLAGRRAGGDALADAQGIAHRALIDVGGLPMLLRPVRALAAAPSVGRIVVSIGEPEVLDTVAELAALRAAGRLVAHPSLDSPSRSVSEVLDRTGDGTGVLATTADHALLTPEMVEHVVDAGRKSRADLLVGVVAATLLRQRFPESKRTWIHLRGESWSGANLFLFRTPQARRVADFWVRAERHRKRPWRLASAIGPGLLLRFLLRRLDLDAALARVGERIGARIEGLPLPWPEAAIDVDRPSDLALAEQLLAAREA
jgi:CTP:molybdopterin cytidylyltransferase MocA